MTGTRQLEHRTPQIRDPEDLLALEFQRFIRPYSEHADPDFAVWPRAFEPTVIVQPLAVGFVRFVRYEEPILAAGSLIRLTREFADRQQLPLAMQNIVDGRASLIVFHNERTGCYEVRPDGIFIRTDAAENRAADRLARTYLRWRDVGIARTRSNNLILPSMILTMALWVVSMELRTLPFAQHARSLIEYAMFVVPAVAVLLGFVTWITGTQATRAWDAFSVLRSSED